MHNLSFARPVARMPGWLAEKLTTDAPLLLDEENLLDAIAGVAPGYPEVFATVEARDAALGLFGPYVEYIPIARVEAEIGGFPFAEVAIGHRLGEAGFERVAAPVLDAIADRMRHHAGHCVVIHRARYLILRQEDDLIRVCGWHPEFDADLDMADGLKTAMHIQSELNRRLQCDAAK
ncbi:hypothetical protein [Bradyrhizobium sp. BR 1432]|uniref:hypothetical protein n=1 Tax=Bradyrhizobium sp. BR 1432 TaxID=3447966 RepID=UPI003EE725D2